MKELKIEVPKGYKIDRENSSFQCIKFKKKQEIKTWDDLCNSDKKITGFYLSNHSNIFIADYSKASDWHRGVFLTRKEARSARASAMISQLMPYYGGAITDEEWADLGMKKHTIYRYADDLFFQATQQMYCFLAFRSKEYKDEFYKHNKQLVKDYLMID